MEQQNEFLPQKQRSTPSSILSANEENLDDQMEITDIFNKYFSTIGECSADQDLPSKPEEDNSRVPIYNTCNSIDINP